jgi:hypothetical protein
MCGLAFTPAGTGIAAPAGPVAAHSMLQLNSPYSFMQAMFAQAAEMNASAIRLDVAPALVFTNPARPPDFSGLDEVMALSQQYRVPVVGDLFTIPPWLASCRSPTDTSQMDRCGTDDLAGYRSVITEIVAHADPLIHDWEIWNEPDNGEFFTGTPHQYAEMLRTAHDAIKAIDPQADVLLGGISSTAGMSWLAQVFSTPGADAAHAFDTANIHERGWLYSLAGDVVGWRRFLAAYGFTGPLWVTEHGYPSDPAYQYDPAYIGGPASQAAYLTASIPTLLDAGAAEVFVTERDNLGGQFASEGVLGGHVSDRDQADPQVIQKAAYAVVRAIAGCYAMLGHDCPGPPPAATPASLVMPAADIRSSSMSTISVSDPGLGPLALGPAFVSDATPGSIAVEHNGCSGLILEPGQSCTMTLWFRPVTGGGDSAMLQLPSNNGPLSVAVTGVAPSVSSLIPSQPAGAAFTPTGRANGVGHTQRLALELVNPLSAPVHVAKSALTGTGAARFLVESDRCAGAELSPGGRCVLSVLFTPTQAGTAQAVLALRGDGTPLSVVLRATGFALPAISRLRTTDLAPCLGFGSHNRVEVTTDQPTTVRWQLLRQGHGPDLGCGGTHLPAPPSRRGRPSAAGRTTTGAHGIRVRGVSTYVARFALPIGGAAGALRPGSYRLTITVTNEHGAGRPRTTWVTVR